MLSTLELCEELHIGREVLDRWIVAGWLSPVVEDSKTGYRAIDVARARFILELADEFELNDHAIGIIIDLIDQILGLRLALRHVLSTR